MTGERVVRCLAALAVSATVAAFLVPLPVGAAQDGGEARPLPAFEAMTLEGQVVQSAELAATGRWLLVYVTPTWEPCVRLLAGMRAWDSADVDARTVAVIGAPVADAAAFVRKHAAKFAAVRWLADPDGAARQALRLTGSPVILGLSDRRIAWTLAGVLNDPNALERVLRGWVEPKVP